MVKKSASQYMIERELDIRDVLSIAQSIYGDERFASQTQLSDNGV